MTITYTMNDGTIITFDEYDSHGVFIKFDRYSEQSEHFSITFDNKELKHFLQAISVIGGYIIPVIEKDK